jgi:hypothetical protein
MSLYICNKCKKKVDEDYLLEHTKEEHYYQNVTYNKSVSNKELKEAGIII